jgi:ABC-type polysaccharide/polyol phosphate export permease
MGTSWERSTSRAQCCPRPPPDLATLLPAVIVSIAVLLAGHRFFRLREARLADVV